jgi:hypothetical protein
MAMILFWVGVLSSALPLLVTCFPGREKVGLVAFPFLMFFGSAVAKYLGG